VPKVRDFTKLCPYLPLLGHIKPVYEVFIDHI